jgi:hypothetical protein
VVRVLDELAARDAAFSCDLDANHLGRTLPHHEPHTALEITMTTQMSSEQATKIPLATTVDLKLEALHIEATRGRVGA